MSAIRRSSRRKAGASRAALAFGILTIFVGFAVAVSFVFGSPRASLIRSEVAQNNSDAPSKRVVLGLFRPSGYYDSLYINGLGVRYDSEAPSSDEELIASSDNLIYAPAEFADEPTADEFERDDSQDVLAFDEPGDPEEALDWGVAQEDPNWRDDIELTDYEVAQFVETPVRVWDYDAREGDDLDATLANYDVFDQLHVESLALEDGATMYEPKSRAKIVATTAAESNGTSELSPTSASLIPSDSINSPRVVSSSYLAPQETSWTQGAATASSFASSRVY